MTKQAARIFTNLFLVLFLASGCATAQVGPETGKTNEASMVVHEVIKSSKSWNGDTLPAYPQGQPEITILRIDIPAGARLEKHSHPVINGGVLMRGELTVVTEDCRTLHLKPGDPIIEVVNTWHYGINDGDVPAEIVMFYVGTVGAPITVLKP